MACARAWVCGQLLVEGEMTCNLRGVVHTHEQDGGGDSTAGAHAAHGRPCVTLFSHVTFECVKLSWLVTCRYPVLKGSALALGTLTQI